jgi:hypothetical protein
MRLASQIVASMLPIEILRKKGYAQVDFTLEAFARLALQGSLLGIDLWNFRAEEKNSILVCHPDLALAFVCITVLIDFNYLRRRANV